MRAWLDAHPDERRSAKGKPWLSNRTDNESAKMATGKGVIQGYTGVAAVDAKTQIVVDAQVHGTNSEQELLLPVVEAVEPFRTPNTTLCADAGYHSEANLKALAEGGVDAYICDNDYRNRDDRYAGQASYKDKPDPLWDKRKVVKKARCFRPANFTLAEDCPHCVCPAGNKLYSNGSNCTFNGYVAMKFRGAERDCVPCPLCDQCLRTPDTTKTRQVAFFQGKRDSEVRYAERMKRRIDSDTGKRMITARFATVEPIFGNLRNNKRLHRFTLRGRAKVDGQWKLYCLVHNIEKFACNIYA
ncbi:transposase [Parazoarcus communis]|uniref:transposase n=1 Tax=Parazoarcus communis TaxID=41977 RepID=UPI001A9D2715